MRLLWALFLLELRSQTRCLRGGSVALVLPILGSVPAATAWLRRGDWGWVASGAAYAAVTLVVLVPLAALVATLVGADAAVREREEGSWFTHATTPVATCVYLGARWLAVLGVLLPLSLVPLASTGALAGTAGVAILPGHLWWGWVLQVAPVVVGCCALGFGAATILGNATGGVVVALLSGGALLATINRLLDTSGLHFEGPAAWIGLSQTEFLVSRVLERDPRGPGLAFPATVAPPDWLVASDQMLAVGVLPFTYGLAVLALAVVFQRRTRRHVGPTQRHPDHPLRSLLGWCEGVWERYAPDARLTHLDRASAALGFVLLGGGVLVVGLRGRAFLAEGRDHATVLEGAATMSPDLIAQDWRIEGAVGVTGPRSLSLEVSGSLHNRGAKPQPTAVFELNPGVRLARVSSSRGMAVARRGGAVVEIDLSPAIEPGETRGLEFVLAGRPGDVVFPIGEARLGPTLRRLSEGHNPDRIDIARSWLRPAISPTRVHLRATDLTPVPRYAGAGSDGRAVVGLDLRPRVAVTLALEGPPGLFLADSCGNTARPAGAGVELVGTCELSLDALVVAGGGGLVTLPREPGDPVLAVFPAHQDLGREYLGVVRVARELVRAAWPGLAEIGGAVLLEWPDGGALEADRLLSWGLFFFSDSVVDPDWPRPANRLVFLPEFELVQPESVRFGRREPERLAADLLAKAILARRPLAAGDALFLEQFVVRLAEVELGLGPAAGAVVGPIDTGLATFTVAPAEAASVVAPYYRHRLPGLVVALRQRVGSGALRAAVDEVFARSGELTAAELLGALAAQSADPGLGRFLTDQVLGAELAQVSLEAARVGRRRVGAGRVGSATGGRGGWVVEVDLRNDGTGLAECRVVVTTDGAVGEAMVAVEAGSSHTATFETADRPQVVVLDPDATCHRYRAAVTRERLNLEGEHAGV